MASKKAAEKYAEELYDLLTNGDATSHEIMDKLGWSYSQFQAATQKLRDLLAADGDVISVVADSQGRSGPWLFGLRGGGAIVDAEQSRWVPNRLADAERRIKTISHVLEVAVNALDGRTTEGKKARIYHLHITRAQEEVALMSTDSGESA